VNQKAKAYANNNKIKITKNPAEDAIVDVNVSDTILNFGDNRTYFNIFKKTKIMLTENV
jgi:hypothetical protein